jgi:hypothetical protein
MVNAEGSGQPSAVSYQWSAKKLSVVRSHFIDVTDKCIEVESGWMTASTSAEGAAANSPARQGGVRRSCKNNRAPMGRHILALFV